MQRWILTLLLVGCLSTLALAMGADHDSKQPVGGTDAWPAGLKELVNRPGRVHGYFVNWEEVFFYSGDTASLNDFLKDYAKLSNTTMQVVLHVGPKKARSPWDKADRDIAVEWSLYTTPYTREQVEAGKTKGGLFVTRLDVYVGGRIVLDRLVVPENVKVSSGGDIEAFVAKHTQAATQPAAAATSSPAAQVQPPYTDEEATKFAAKLSEIAYPTTIETACKTLGIEKKRLFNNGIMKSEINGRSGQSWTRLSPTYWIAFQFDVQLEAGFMRADADIKRVVIYKLKTEKETQEK